MASPVIPGPPYESGAGLDSDQLVVKALPLVTIGGRVYLAVRDPQLAAALDDILATLREIRDRLPTQPGV